MDKELLDILNTIVNNMATKDDIDTIKHEMATKADVAEVREEMMAIETRLEVFVENNVSKKLDALFDGYKMSHEKQEELQQQVNSLEERVASIESRIA